MGLIRTMTFYDGNYFKQGQIYFRYKESRGWFSLPQLHSFLDKYVASKEKSPYETTKMVASPYYDGRPTTKAVDAQQLERDRDFEMALIAAGVVPHYLAMSERPKPDEEEKYQIAQKASM